MEFGLDTEGWEEFGYSDIPEKNIPDGKANGELRKQCYIKDIIK